ncbi:hypothetical protein J5Y09_18240 [Roseomonas sp. PWR1]|uniref:SF3 helicase domain-containing protein n=1 Tax=Roseomonas nitratireducens TaxID=2820810 RepID=A0ABS4AWY2_9PROT|nr:phage/plasmid primase, P4 family [Neoroseomonas nitratireducens]MBP0465872.1 hypothetical protein [Neoroseomonas nitratireducens]
MKDGMKGGTGGADIVTQETDEQELTRLAALAPFEYDRQRAGAAKALGVSVRTLDKQIRQRHAVQKATSVAVSTVRGHDAIALAFVQENAERMKYCAQAGGWFVFQRGVWRKDEDGFVRDAIREQCRVEAAQASGLGPRERLAMQAASFVNGVEALAKVDRAVVIEPSLFDADPWLLGTPEGVVDLRSGVMRPGRAMDFVSMTTAVGPADTEDCPRWHQFLQEITRNRQELIDYLQAALGYSIIGLTDEQIALVMYGPGGNGKGVLLNTVAHVLKDYAKQGDLDLFRLTRGDKHPTGMARLKGARLLTVSEMGADDTLDAMRLKALTGGDPVAARFMGKDFFTMTPSFTPVISTNHMPRLAEGIQPAMTRRLRVVPFDAFFENPDATLSERLKGEARGILRWLVNGAARWGSGTKLDTPESVNQATQQYFINQDTVGAWIAGRCVTGGRVETPPSALLADYNQWARVNRERELSRATFKEEMTRRPRSFRWKAVNGVTVVEGIRLREGSDFPA